MEKFELKSIEERINNLLKTTRENLQEGKEDSWGRIYERGQEAAFEQMLMIIKQYK